MKKLNITEKAIRYDVAIERAKYCLKDGTITNTAISYIETIFPELKESEESEDERIRKAIRTIILSSDTKQCQIVGVSQSDMFEWIEKQGEQIPANSVKTCKDEQKPAWSEEDKRIIDNLVSQLCNLYTRKLIKEETKNKYVNWLKSLRPHNTWKPSDNQMKDE